MYFLLFFDGHDIPASGQFHRITWLIRKTKIYILTLRNYSLSSFLMPCNSLYLSKKIKFDQYQAIQRQRSRKKRTGKKNVR